MHYVDHHSFLAVLDQHKINPQDVEPVIAQGLHMEKLTLEAGQAVNSPEKQFEIECRILQTETLLSLLRVASLRA